MTKDLQEEFKFLIAQQKSVCVVSLIGLLDDNATAKIQECQEQLQTAGCHFLLLNFRDVIEIKPTTHRHLIQLQHSIRSIKGQAVRLCGVRPAWQVSLVENGVIRKEEIVDNVRKALVELSTFEAEN